MNYFIADLHIYHKNIIRLDDRPFDTLEEMHKYIIEQWNSKVTNRDTVYILGDLSWGNAENTMNILRKLKGKKILITGNHDQVVNKESFDKTIFDLITPYLEIQDMGKKICLCHYPITFYNGQFRGSMMLCGHIHGTDDVRRLDNYNRYLEEEIPFNVINCWCMYSDFVPLSLSEWIEVENQRRMSLNLKPIIV